MSNEQTSIRLHDGTTVPAGTPVRMIDSKYYALTDEEIAERAEGARFERGERLVKLLSEYRYEKEVGGIQVNGIDFPTDRFTQGRLSESVTLLAHMPPDTVIDWKVSDGVWVEFTVAQMIAAGVAVGSHVRKCFKAERVLSGVDFAAGYDLAVESDFESASSALRQRFDEEYAKL